MDKIYARIAPDGTPNVSMAERELLQRYAGCIAEISPVNEFPPEWSLIPDVQMLPLNVVVQGLNMQGRYAGNSALDSHAFAEETNAGHWAHGINTTDATGTEGTASTETIPETIPESTGNGMLVETDVLAAFLCRRESASLLRRALATGMCYTTFVQLSEVLACIPEHEQGDALAALSLLRPLGAHPRYASDMAQALPRATALAPTDAFRFAVTAAIARQSRLPVLTVRHRVVYSRLDISTINGNALRL
ncbi:MAG: hypothetical protein ACK54V_02750 [Candidatus Kapaibacterium sp.]|jgi:hypothetical protein